MLPRRKQMEFQTMKINMSMNRMHLVEDTMRRLARQLEISEYERILRNISLPTRIHHITIPSLGQCENYQMAIQLLRILSYRTVNRNFIAQRVMQPSLRNYRNSHGNRNELVEMSISKPIPRKEKYDIENLRKRQRSNGLLYDQVFWISMAVRSTLQPHPKNCSSRQS